MVSYSWMFTESFLRELEAKVERTAIRQGMQAYETQIVSDLVSRLKKNRDQQRHAELLKEVKARKTKADALRSVEFLVRKAALRARAQRRTTITFDDYEVICEAYRCTFWPFCRK